MWNFVVGCFALIGVCSTLCAILVVALLLFVEIQDWRTARVSPAEVWQDVQDPRTGARTGMERGGEGQAPLVDVPDADGGVL